MDLIDRKILCELDMDCRMPLSRIAKKLRIGKNVAGYRIKNLEKTGVIKSYICSVNLGTLGYNTYKIYFKLNGERKAERQFVKSLQENSSVIHFLKTEGSYDYAVTIATRTVSDLDRFLTGVRNKFSGIIKEHYISILVYSRLFKLNKLLLDEKSEIKDRPHRYSGEAGQAELDDKDKRILKEISQAANMPIVDIAKRTKLSLDTVKYRMKVLRWSPIVYYRAFIDINKLGMYHYVIMLKTKNLTQSDEERLMTWCMFKKNVLYCTKRVGNFDFEINVAITDINDLNGFISQLKEEFYSITESYQTIINSEMLKLNYVPF